VPANFVYVGLIHLALPDVRIINVRRSPIDSFMSFLAWLFASKQPRSPEGGPVTFGPTVTLESVPANRSDVWEVS